MGFIEKCLYTVKIVNILQKKVEVGKVIRFLECKNVILHISLYPI